MWCSIAPEGRAPRLRRAVRAAALASLLLPALAAPPARAETVLSRLVEIAFDDDGTFRKRTALRVRSDEAGDLDDWSPWTILLDENRTLTTVSATAWRPDGSVVVLGEEDVTTVEGLAGGSVLHSSAAARLLRFPPLPGGSRLQVSWEVHEDPWIESTSIPLLLREAPVEELVVSISGAGPGLRWRIDPPEPAGSPPRLRVEESPGALRVTASGLEAASGPAPVLRLAWGARSSWSEVGGWYEDLVRDVPRRPAAVVGLARELVAGAPEPRERVEILLDHVRRRVRYVAVEVGVGGYRPSPPGEVLERRWGDCKDKSFLLLDLLAEAGIEAYPALVLVDDERKLDEAFPGADQFNHLIVVIPVAAVSLRPGDAASERYLFLDPTQESGGLAWIHPALQGQTALVVRGDASDLDQVPVLPERELRDLTVRLAVDETGGAAGEAVYRVTGHGAWSLSGAIASATPEAVAARARRVLSEALPGAHLGAPSWRQGDDGGVPVVELSAPIRVERLVEGRRTRSLSLPATGAFPAPAELDPVEPRVRSIRPVLWRAVWNLDLPAGWCAPEPSDERLDNDVGSFRQVVAVTDGGNVRIERRAETARRWVDGPLLAAARELALAESRAARRRVRLGCSGEPRGR